MHGLRGQTSLVDRVEWDNYYIENWNLLLDFGSCCAPFRDVQPKCRARLALFARSNRSRIALPFGPETSSSPAAPLAG